MMAAMMMRSVMRRYRLVIERVMKYVTNIVAVAIRRNGMMSLAASRNVSPISRLRNVCHTSVQRMMIMVYDSTIRSIVSSET
jgi:hypothetical protein